MEIHLRRCPLTGESSGRENLAVLVPALVEVRDLAIRHRKPAYFKATTGTASSGAHLQQTDRDSFFVFGNRHCQSTSPAQTRILRATAAHALHSRSSSAMFKASSVRSETLNWA